MGFKSETIGIFFIEKIFIVKNQIATTNIVLKTYQINLCVKYKYSKLFINKIAKIIILKTLNINNNAVENKIE